MRINKSNIKNTEPINNWEFPTLLDYITTNNLKEELKLLFKEKRKDFKLFDRNGSAMYEWCKYSKQETPAAYDLIAFLHSTEWVKYLEELTGINGLLPDIHLHGAGYMRCGNGDSLKIHTDFNWNDTIKLNRVLTLVIYLNQDWKEEWNGDIQLWDKGNQQCVKQYFPNWGNCIMWEYDELGFHGHPNPLNCPEGEYRDGFRIFYYTSNSTNENPHRSLYWFDGEKAIDETK
jgi:Rps23 Pro-64 3,4-dihydroxylase Tpa1-like proline 4-hydroxylase